MTSTFGGGFEPDFDARADAGGQASANPDILRDPLAALMTMPPVNQPFFQIYTIDSHLLRF